jgi:hypothetical protein
MSWWPWDCRGCYIDTGPGFQQPGSSPAGPPRRSANASPRRSLAISRAVRWWDERESLSIAADGRWFAVEAAFLRFEHAAAGCFSDFLAHLHGPADLCPWIDDAIPPSHPVDTDHHNGLSRDLRGMRQAREAGGPSCLRLRPGTGCESRVSRRLLRHVRLRPPMPRYKLRTLLILLTLGAIGFLVFSIALREAIRLAREDVEYERTKAAAKGP